MSWFNAPDPARLSVLRVLDGALWGANTLYCHFTPAYGLSISLASCVRLLLLLLVPSLLLVLLMMLLWLLVLLLMLMMLL